MNTTDISITCFDDETVNHIAAATGIPLKKTSDGEKCGGPKVSCLHTYGACVACLSSAAFESLLEAFTSAPWQFPELASMAVSCDDSEERSKVYTI